MRHFALHLAIIAAAFLGSSASAEDAKKTDAKKPVPKAAAPKITYAEQVRAVFRNRCLSCHNQNTAKGDLALDNYQAVMQGGASGQVVVAGKLADSRLWALVNHDDEPTMPPEADKLPAKELELIKAWIELGAPENAGSNVTITKPEIDLTASAGSARPSGPPPLPGPLIKETLVQTKRAGSATAIAASPWAPVVAIAGHKQILLYHTDTAKLLGVMPFPEGKAQVLRFSRSGSLLLAGGGRAGLLGKVAVFEIKTGKRVFEVGDELDTVLAADINEDHTMIALGGPRRLVRVYSTADGSLIYELKKHTDWVYGIEFSPDGVLLATSDRSGGMFVWEADTGREYLSLRGHNGAITDVSWRLDSNLLASSGEDGTVRLWEMNNGGQVRSWNAHGGGAATVDFTHDGRLVSSGRDRVTKIFDQAGQPQRSLEAFADIGLEAVFSHDGKRVVAGDWSGEIRMWDAADGKRLANLSVNPPPLAERLAEATKALAASQALQQQLAAASTAAQAASAKAQTDVAAAQKVLTDANAALAKKTGEVEGAKRAVAAATAAQQQAAAALKAQEANLAKANQAVEAAKAAAAKSPGDKALADKVAIDVAVAAKNASQLEASKAEVAKHAAELPKAQALLASLDKELAAAAAAIKPAQAALAARTAAIKPAADRAAAAKKTADDAAANAVAAAKNVDELKQDIALAKAAGATAMQVSSR